MASLSTYPNFGTFVAIPQNPYPTTIADSDTWESGLILAGFGAIVAAVNSSEDGAINIQRYADLEGLVPVGALVTANITGGTAQWATVHDGLPYLSFTVEITNSGGDPADITNIAILTGPLAQT